MGLAILAVGVLVLHQKHKLEEIDRLATKIKRKEEEISLIEEEVKGLKGRVIEGEKSMKDVQDNLLSSKTENKQLKRISR